MWLRSEARPGSTDALVRTLRPCTSREHVTVAELGGEQRPNLASHFSAGKPLESLTNRPIGSEVVLYTEEIA